MWPLPRFCPPSYSQFFTFFLFKAVAEATFTYSHFHFHFLLSKAAAEANLDLSFDWRGRDVVEEELLEELPDLEDMEELLAQLIH